MHSNGSSSSAYSTVSPVMTESRMQGSILVKIWYLNTIVDIAGRCHSTRKLDGSLSCQTGLS